MAVDLIIQNAKVYNSFLKTFQVKNISIKEGKFYYIAQEDLTYLDANETIDGSSYYVVPGLIDIHMHIESSMIPPTTFSDVALTHGTTTIVADCHEIANVFGMEGIQSFLDQETVLDIFYAIPSSVPSTTVERETTGGYIGVDQVRDLLNHPRVIALGEAMNFKGITSQPSSLIRQILCACQSERPLMPLEGHIPRVSGEDLAKFMFVGLTADHTHQSPQSIYEKVSNGIFVELQKKSITEENIQVIKDYQLYEHTCLITDDIMPDDLIEGQLNANLKLAVEKGLSMEEAIYMASYTPARRMGFRDRGAIASGFVADFLLIDDLDAFHIEAVYKNGKKVQPYQNQVFSRPDFPEHFYQSVQCRPLEIDDLLIKVDTGADQVLCNVIQIEEVGTFTQAVQEWVPVKNGYLDWQASNLALILVMERYGKNGQIGYGLVKNTFKQPGAVATTWAHDHHNLMVMGTTMDDMIAAQRKVLAAQGGYTVSKDKKIQAFCGLPIAGILSDQPLETVGVALSQVRKAMKDLGYVNTNEIMSFSTLSLPVSPAIKITDYGMMDVHTHRLIPLMEVNH